MVRHTFILFLMILILGCGTKNAQTLDALLFPVDDFKIETKIVKTTSGEKKVTYRSYMHIPYVANPIDKDYQSLNVSVPIKIDGVDVDASNAPILFKIGVGGYMSVRNAEGGEDKGVGGPPPRFRSSARPEKEEPTISANDALALAAGYVVVYPGCRGRDNQAADGTYYGKAPAAIVDLKAAVRYIRHNKGVIPGNVNQIVSVGCSAGGALSAVLGASGNSDLYSEYLNEIGAAEASDAILASACYSPITDLEHSDMAYEWMYGESPTRNGIVNQELSKELKDSYAKYQSFLEIEGKETFGILTAENYKEYLIEYYLTPSLKKFLLALTTEERAAYLNENSWIQWTDENVDFSFQDYVSHVGRMKGLPSFDDFDKKQPEPILFGTSTENARHFTAFSLQQETGNKNADISKELKEKVVMMNALPFVQQDYEDTAKFWWLRNGTSDNHTSQTVMINLATELENIERNVNTWLFWDGGHCSDNDPEGFISWIGKITEYN